MKNINSPSSLQAWLLYWSAHKGDNSAMVQPFLDGSVLDLSWREVASQALRLAAYLDQLKLPKESSIALFANNSVYWIITDMAIGFAGHVSVPIYSAAKPSLCRHVIEHSDVKAVFYDNETQVQATKQVLAEGRSIEWIYLPSAQHASSQQWASIQRTFEPIEVPVIPDADSLYTIAYTSGSTGIPKGVMHSACSPILVAEGLNQESPLTPEERLLSYLPLAHLAERGSVEAVAIRYGLTLYFSAGLETFNDDICRARPTLFFSVPRLWTKFYQRAVSIQAATGGEASNRDVLRALGLDYVKCAMSGSASLPEAIINYFHSLGIEILECYGMSENFGYSHGSRAGNVRVGYVGAPSPQVECRLTDEGEVLVKSPSMMLGYFKDEKATASVLTPDGFLRTGDLGHVDEQSRLKLIGRSKELFKTSKGKYVAPLPIEMALCNSTSIDNVCVMGENFQKPIALLQPSEEALDLMLEDESATTKRLLGVLNTLNDVLEEHEKLAKLIVLSDPWTVENECLTVTLKIKRTVIEQRYQKDLSTWYETPLDVLLHLA